MPLTNLCEWSISVTWIVHCLSAHPKNAPLNSMYVKILNNYQHMHSLLIIPMKIIYDSSITVSACYESLRIVKYFPYSIMDYIYISVSSFIRVIIQCTIDIQLKMLAKTCWTFTLVLDYFFFCPTFYKSIEFVIERTKYVFFLHFNDFLIHSACEEDASFILAYLLLDMLNGLN